MKATYTETELRIISQLRSLVEDVLEDDYENSDDFLVTWIRYANHDLIKAEQAVRNNKRWRIENEMDKILSEDMDGMEAEYPIESHGFDKDGCPLLAMKMDVDAKKVVSTPGGKQAMIRYMLMKVEATHTSIKRQHKETDGRVKAFSAVIDMEGFSFSQLTSSKVISTLTELARTAEENYPGVTKNLYVVNAPRMFKILLNVVKPFLSEDTISRFRIFDSKKEQWRQALLETISYDQLPQFAAKC